jgi:hypothetical protein
MEPVQEAVPARATAVEVSVRAPGRVPVQALESMARRLAARPIHPRRNSSAKDPTR